MLHSQRHVKATPSLAAISSSLTQGLGHPLRMQTAFIVSVIKHLKAECGQPALVHPLLMDQTMEVLLGKQSAFPVRQKGWDQHRGFAFVLRLPPYSSSYVHPCIINPMQACMGFISSSKPLDQDFAGCLAGSSHVGYHDLWHKMRLDHLIHALFNGLEGKGRLVDVENDASRQSDALAHRLC